MKADSSAGKKVVFNSDSWRFCDVAKQAKYDWEQFNNALWRVMLTQCWFNVGQRSDISVQPWTNTGSMSRICGVIPLIDQSRPCERYGLVNVAYYMINHTHNCRL